MKALFVLAVLGAAAALFTAATVADGAGPPSPTCTAPPSISSINPRSVAEPPAAGEFNTGTFHVHGTNFQEGQVFTDGPLSLDGGTFVNPTGRLASRAFTIGFPAPVPGETFNIFVVTPCGEDSIAVLITD